MRLFLIYISIYKWYTHFSRMGGIKMLYVIIIIIFLSLIACISITYNSLVKLYNRVKEAFSTMDVYLKKRWDLIPNIVETVKGYSKQEKETLTEVVKIRSSSYDDMSINDKVNINTKLSDNIDKLMALAEAYPELKANENYLDLSKKLTEIEEDIANSRKYYNGSVRIYNNKVEMFPSNIIAKIFGFKSEKMFEISEDEKQNIKIEL